MKSQYNHGYSVNKGEEEKSFNQGTFFYQAIENADGVPFQLIFGPEIGEGYYLNMGSGIKQLLGIQPEDFTEKMFLGMAEIVMPLCDGIYDDPGVLRDKFIRGEINNYKAEVLVRTPCGEKKWIHDASIPIRDEDTGKVIGAFGILYDINRRTMKPDSTEKCVSQDEEHENFKSTFLRNISHEIRTPLNAIVGFSALIDNNLSPEQQQEYKDIINKSSEHLLEIMNDIVEMSTIESGNLKLNYEKVNLDNMLQSIYDKTAEKAKDKGISFSYTKVPDNHDTIIITDKCKLKQAILNLVGNALKFTTRGEVKFGYTINGENVLFFVSDTGIGIIPENRTKIFSSFFQAESSSTRRFEGTGLGLTIAKAYINLLGGEIWFNSRPGAGSVFYISLPFVGKKL